MTLTNMPDGGLLLAVDGPSGTGKSTTCRNLAKILDAKYVDTGAMYRVATLAVLRAGVDPTDKAGVIAVTEDLPLGISSDPDSTEVFLGNEDISRAIREDEVTRNVSAVSAIPEVRDNLVRLQRKIALESGRAIVEGRDIGTVVLADSPAKAYMTASAEVRAQRRFDQNQAAGMNADFDVILADIQRRDDADSSRETSPLRPAKDAVIVDTSNLSREEVIEALLNIVKESAND